MLPDANGFAVCEEIRSTHPLVPVIMLTARSQETDKIRGLDAGADDYVTKPFSVGELVARINAMFRRLHRGAGHRERADRDRRRGRRSAQARADPQGEDARAVVLRGRAAAPAVGARGAAGHARGDPGEDLGRARARRARAASTTSWSSCARRSRRTRPSRATSSPSTGPATSWWCDDRDRRIRGRGAGAATSARARCGRASRWASTSISRSAACAARIATSRSTRAPASRTTRTPTPWSPRSRARRRWFDGRGAAGVDLLRRRNARAVARGRARRA